MWWENRLEEVIFEDSGGENKVEKHLGEGKVLNKIQRTRSVARLKKDSLPHLHISCALFNETYAYQPIVTPTMELYTDT